MATTDLFSPRYREVVAVVESAVQGAAEYLIGEARAGTELEVTVKADNLPFRAVPEKMRGRKTIQQATVFLPESKRTVTTMLALTPEQETLLALKTRFWVSQ